VEPLRAQSEKARKYLVLRDELRGWRSRSGWISDRLRSSARKL
jgi:chromosome segregation protein